MNNEKTACQLFDTGQFNEISRAYLIIAMYNLQMPKGWAGDLLNEIGALMDTIPAEEALKVMRQG